MLKVIWKNIKQIPTKLKLLFLKIIYRKRLQFNLKSNLFLQNKFQIYIDRNVNSKIKINGNLSTRGLMYVRVDDGGEIIIGSNCFFNRNCSLSSRDKIIIGNNCMFANNVVIIDNNHKFGKIENIGYTSKKITIEDNVWIGANSVILEGVKIGKGAVVAAGSIVNKDVEEYTMVAGVPAEKIKNLE